jgi:hypothetical protein
MTGNHSREMDAVLQKLWEDKDSTMPHRYNAYFVTINIFLSLLIDMYMHLA